MGVIRFFGFEVDGVILSDSSGALSLSQRQGVGHQRHIEAGYLWIQDHVQRGTFKVGKIPGSLNKADVGTKHVARDDLLRHIRALGLREWQAPDESPRDVSTITNRLSMMWEGCTPKFCKSATFHRGGVSENLVIFTHLVFDVITVLCLSAIVLLQRQFSLVTFSFCATTVVCKRAVHFNDVCVA